MNCMFASDNTVGVHPTIMNAIQEANIGSCKPYGADEYCEEAENSFKKIFGDDIETFFVLSGTGANVLALRSILRPWHGTICTDISHINTDECGAPEACTGSKLLAVPSVNGKLTPAGIHHYLLDLNNVHHVKPALVSITQSTEQGSMYTVDEIKAITKIAHDNGLYVHMDGARIANAVAALGIDCKAMTKDAGIDVLSFGGTKNGMMMGEAVVYFTKGLSGDFYHQRKQSLQHLSKMRFIAAQFTALFKDNLWLENAKHANSMAQYLAKELAKVPNISISRQTEANAVFSIMPQNLIKRLQKNYYFYEINPEIHETRLMCSFLTQKEDIDIFIQKAIECQKD